ncbi:hypothetical protein DFH08DRAFT_1073977 [Mycena albidolilacea]|uniref:Uncharacterized protein n=1 Tax=Mycena albidolilacea TaxID=1033008 RepID=A0AAD7F0U8_9AGAR|nr:hypothetical protein DFH08DRAFT_1073977 [Mycena albidolilacea]
MYPNTFTDGRQSLTKKSLLGKPKNKPALLAYVAATGGFPRYAPALSWIHHRPSPASYPEHAAPTILIRHYRIRHLPSPPFTLLPYLYLTALAAGESDAPRATVA